MKERKYYPLTQGQMILFYQMKFCIRKQCVNLCTEIEFQDEVNTNLMLQALNLGMLRAPSLSVRLHRNEDKSYVQYFSDEAPDKIEYLDLSDMSEEDFAKLIKKWNETPFKNMLCDTQLYNIKLLLKPNGKYAIYGNYCHIIADAYAIMANFKDIMAVYDAINNRKPMPAPLPSPVPAYEADYKYQSSEKNKEDLDYFRNVVFDTEPQFTTANGCNSKEFLKDKKYGKYHYTPTMKGDNVIYYIPAEVDKASTEFALANKVSPQTMYLLAIRTYMSAVNKTDDVMFTSPVARRATIAQKKAGGTMVNAVPMRLRFNNETSFIDACKQTYVTQCETYKHANCATGDILEMLAEKFGAPKTSCYINYGVTYQPYFMVDESINVKFKRMSNGTETQSFYMSIMPADNKGTMSVDYSYQVGVLTEETLKKFHGFIVEFLKSGVKNPDKPLNYFIEILI